MDNQHRLIAGYRELSETEIALMNEITAKAAEVGELVERLETGLLDGPELEPVEVQIGEARVLAVSGDEYEVHRWLEIGKGHLQQGFMALTRAVTRPTGF